MEIYPSPSCPANVTISPSCTPPISVTSTINWSMHTLPITGARFPCINTCPLPDSALGYPSAYPAGMVAIFVSLVVVNVPPYPISQPASTVFTNDTKALSSIAGISLRRSFATSPEGYMPYKDIPYRTISRLTSCISIIPALFETCFTGSSIPSSSIRFTNDI